MRKKKRSGLFFTIVSVFLFLSLAVWYLTQVFEGEKPQIRLQPLPDFISGTQRFTLNISDTNRGLRSLSVSVSQGNREINILKESFPFKDLLNRDGFHRFSTEFSLDPGRLNLSQGEICLKVSVWDYSRRRGGDGNLSVFSRKMVVDTIQPALRAISRRHYLNSGGAGLIVYQASQDTVESGVFVASIFYAGFSVNQETKEGSHLCYFGVPYNAKSNLDIHLWAKDRAGNISTAKFYYRIRRKTARKVKMNISDRFLERVIPDFSYDKLTPGTTNIQKFIIVNSELRKENTLFFNKLKTKTSAEQLWNGAAWMRLKNAATMAWFGDERSYYYKGKNVSNAVHMGMDLASLANSEVQAANNGHVIFAGPLGIYGRTVVLDHGQGLASTYSHLSSITVKVNDLVNKGHPIGFTGQTGLAGGDHLHFGVMVGGVFVNPIEWWDSHWIQDNIKRKLALLKKQD